jgi:hypothetical protein
MTEVVSSVSLVKYLESTPKQATATSFHILSKSLFTYHPTIRRYIVRDILIN